MKVDEDKYIFKLILLMMYLSISIVFQLFDGFNFGKGILLGLFLISISIIIIDSRLISLAKLFCLSYLALNLSSIIYFTFIDQSGDKYLFITHCSFALFSLSYHLFSIRDETKFEFNVFEKLSSLNIGNKKLYLLYSPVLLSILLMMIEFGPSSLINIASHTRSDTKEASGILWLASKYLLMMYLPCCFIQGYKIYSTNKLSKILNSVIFVFLMLVVFLFLRTRTYLLGPLITIFIGYFFALIGNKKDIIKIDISQYLKIFILALIVVALAASVRFIRGIIEVGEGNLNFSLIAEKTLIEGDLGYGHLINQIMTYSDDNEVKLDGQSYYRLLLTPIPRSIYEDKPENTQRIVGRWLYPDSIFMTVPPGIQGDTYINFSYYGVLLFILYGLIFRVIDRNSSIITTIFIASSFMPMFHLVRGGFTNPVIIFVFTYVFTIVVYNVFFRYENK